jgi:hypothetical protein
MAENIDAAPVENYSPEDRAFYAFWYGHMIGDVMQAPLADVAHSTARYIWDAGRRTPSASIGEDGLREPSRNFNDWWNADRFTQTNPFREDSPAYWAWEGWTAALASIGEDAWHAAVLAECMRVESCYKADDPVGTLAALINWHTTEASAVAETIKIHADAYLRLTCGSIGEDGLPELPRHRFTVLHAESEWSCAGNLSVYTADQMKAYALDAIAADRRHQSSMQKVHIHSDDVPSQAAQGVKTWQERAQITDKELSDPEYMRGYVESQNESFADAMALITDLRAQIARQSQVDEAEIYAIWDAAKAEAAMYVEGHCVDGEMHARHIMSAARPKVTAASPLSREQQPEKGEKK